jgi:mannose/fructose-specific phosphotransferase system component IIA
MTNEVQAPARPRLAGVIVTHAGLASALRDAAAAVAGDAAGLEPLSNEGLGPEALAERVRATVDALGADGTIVFVDSRGSSCAASCIAALRHDPRVRVVSGVNLPMLVDFLLRRRDHDLDGLVERLLQRGRDSVQLLKGPPS